MPKDTNPASTISLANLPAIGGDLEGGTFAGLTTTPNGAHVAVVLLPGAGTDLTWTKAKAWAKKQGGELPSRPVAALLFANIKSALQPRWHWTSDEEDRGLLRSALLLRRRPPEPQPQELRRWCCCRPPDSAHRLILQSFLHSRRPQ